MKKFIIDFEFNERTGESRVVIDFVDESMSALEMNEAIRSGDVQNEVADQAATLLGAEVAAGVRNGTIKLVCLDHHPELRRDTPGVALATAEAQKKVIKQ